MNFRHKKNIIIVSAHEDDEVLGCGGIIQKHIEDGHDIYLCVATKGWSYIKNQKKESEKRSQCKKSSKLLGIKKIFFLNFPTLSLGGPDTHKKLNVKLEKIFSRIKPSIVYAPSHTDINKDHVAVQKSIEVVCRPGKKETLNLEEIYEYEILSATEWSRSLKFNPNTYVNIEKYIEKKIEAMKIYSGEIRKYPNSRSQEGIRIQAKYRGLQCGIEYAEAFNLIYKINI